MNGGKIKRMRMSEKEQGIRRTKREKEKQQGKKKKACDSMILCGKKRKKGCKKRCKVTGKGVRSQE